MATTGLLMGCVESGGKGSTGDSAGLAAAPAKKKSGAQDVEAPEVFQANDSALWDGRPSLGGIWVASPDVTNPERVVMFNPATGKSVTGALFKRERDNPGPKLQLSSDAAEALGILAGQPTEIKVTALRKVEETAPVATAAATAPADPAAAPAKDGDAAAVAAAALAAVDADKTKTDPKTKDSDPAAATTAGTAAVAATAVEGGAAVVDGAPKKKTWKERRAEAKAAREAKKKAAAEAKAAAAAAAAGTAVAAEGEAPTTTPDAAAAAVAPIESAPLDARNPDVAKAADKASKKASKSKATPAVEAPAAAAAVPADPAAPVVAGGPSRPIQVASFSKEDNAKRAAEALAKIGVTATPQKSEKAGKAVWGVVVTGDDAMLQKIKDAGFADAYFLK
ncbi:MAG: SPOR domain-containing protein [Tabrizicola sp.]|jgi:hypothetical protein|nr:SPOR domain-containing protein [Tabrizicola sp.]